MSWAPFIGMTVAWLFALYGNHSLLQTNKKVQRINHELTDDLVEAQSGLVEAEKKHAEYRAAYRDLLDDYTRLHTAYKEQG